MICLVDNSEHADLAALHKHLRTLGLKQSDYYHKHHPRFDLFSGEPVPFVPDIQSKHGAGGVLWLPPQQVNVSIKITKNVLVLKSQSE